MESSRQEVKLDIDKAEDLLLSIKEEMDSAGIRFWLHFGTLLAAVRDSSFRPDDVDIDLMIMARDGAAVFDLFRGKGYNVTRMGISVIGVCKDAALAQKGLEPGAQLVVQLYDPISKCYITPAHINRPVSLGLGTFHYAIPKRYLDKKNYVDFLGAKFRTPWNAEAFLADIYGDWRTPLTCREWKQVRASVKAPTVEMDLSRLEGRRA